MEVQGLFKKKFIYFGILILIAGCGSSSHSPPPITFQKLREFPHELVSPQIRFGSSIFEVKNFDKNVRALGPIRKLKIPSLNLETLKNGDYFPSIAGAQTLSQTNKPHVPFLIFRIPLQPGTQGKVQLINPTLEESTQSVPISKSSGLYIWGKGKGYHEDSFSSETSLLNKKYYPGKVVETYQENNTLVVKLFPIQINQQTGKVLKLSSAGMETMAEEVMDSEEEASPEKSSIPVLPDSEGLIITSQLLMEGARALQLFHREKLNQKSQIITVEEVNEKESPISHSELPEGYSSPEWFEGIVLSKEDSSQGYDFELAKKLISFLRKSAQTNKRLKYVTLLGDSGIIPPSYYFKRRGHLGISRAGVTDQCYAAGKMCLEALLAVGRLPFENNEEIQAYLTKAKHWLLLNQNNQSDLSLWGGKAFPNSPFYVGELGVLEILSSLDFGWKNTKKFFQTESNFNKSTQLDLFSGKTNSSFVYYLDHGMGNRLYAGQEYLSSIDILKMKRNDENAPPVIASVSCINAAFDEGLLLDDTLDEKDEFGSVSIGTALLKSPQGAIAYLGGTREGLGSPETVVDRQGNVKVVGTSYGLQLLEEFILSPRKSGQKTLGEALLKALNSYARENGNDMDEFFHRYTFWITELLGDPAMPLPLVHGGEENWAPASSRFEVLNEGIGMPELNLEGLEQRGKPLKVFSEETRFTAKVYQMERGHFGFSGEKLIKEIEIEQLGEVDLSSQISSVLENDHQYLVKLINLSGVPKEQHVVFRTQQSSN